MAEFGNHSEGTSTTSSYAYPRAMCGAAQCHTAGAGEKLTKFYVKMGRTDATSGEVHMALYTLSGGRPTNMLANSQATITVPTNTTTPIWLSSDALSVSMVAGTTYCIAIDMNNDPKCLWYYEASGGTDRSNDEAHNFLTDPWNHTYFSAVLHSMYAEYSISTATKKNKTFSVPDSRILVPNRMYTGV